MDTHFIFVHYNTIDTGDVVDIYKYLTKIILYKK